MTPAAFAIPGDLTTLTGGYIYERRLLEGLRAQGRDVAHIELGASFPNPTPADMAAAVEALCALPPERALILDGLVYGAIETAGLAQVRAPIVAMIHHPLALETGLEPAQKAHLFETERANLALAAHVLVPSDHTARILTQDYAVPAERITCARPGTDSRTRVNTPITPALILSVGLQHPRKGHDTLLHALNEVRDLLWHTIIVGRAHDESHAAELTTLRRSLAMDHRVSFAGNMPQEKLDTLYATATVFALATRYEGYGMVFDEALSWGLPIISCTAGAVPDTVPAGAGRLVSPDAPDAMAQALRDVLTDADARAAMAAAAKTAGAALPGWDTTAQIAGQVLDGLR